MMWNRLKRSHREKNHNEINISTTNDTMYQLAKDIGEIKGSLLSRVDSHEKRIENLEKRVEKLEKIDLKDEK